MKRIVFILLFLLSSNLAFAGVNAELANFKIYKVYFSTNGDCSDPIVVLDASADHDLYPNGYKQINVIANPLIAKETVSEGNYKCVIFELSDSVTFTPAETIGICEVGTEYTINICQPYTGDEEAVTTDPETGTTAVCSSSSGRMWVYISLWSVTGTGPANPYKPPISSNDPTNGSRLGSVVSVSKDITGTFVVDTEEKVASRATGVGGTQECGMEQPNFSFRTE